jgi:hypothetical protein
MPSPRRLGGLLAAATLCVGCGGCTVVKPIVGAVTGPVIMMGRSDGAWCSTDWIGSDWCSVCCGLAMLSAVGAGVGLVTGIVSDIRALTDEAEEPTDNWWDPFAVNR